MWLAWDTAAFWAIHEGFHQPWLDPIMMAFSNPGPFKIPLLTLLGLVFLLRRRRGIVGVLVLALTITASDQLSAKVIKPVLKRSRPSVMLPGARPLFGVRKSNSFPSSHATNFFAAAPVIGHVFPQAQLAAYVLAAAVSISRVYVGDHWPSDVLGGAALGILLGLLGRKAAARLERTISVRGTRDARAPSAARSRPGPAGASRTAGEKRRYTRMRS